MTTITDPITSWDEDVSPFSSAMGSVSAIATESQPAESSAWMECVDALLRIWSESTSHDESRPNRIALEAALCWIQHLRKRFPPAPPTCIIPDPSGGVIVERRDKLATGQERVCEFTFSNDGSAECTVYDRGRVVLLVPIARCPPPDFA